MHVQMKSFDENNGRNGSNSFIANNRIHPVADSAKVEHTSLKISSDSLESGESGFTTELRHLDETLVLSGYRTSKWKMVLVVFLSILTLGMLYLFMYWYPKLLAKFTCDRSSLSKCTKVLIRDDVHQNIELQMVITKVDNCEKKLNETSSKEVPLSSFDERVQFRYFEYRKMKYIWSEALRRFESIMSLIENHQVNLKRINELSIPKTGLKESEVEKLAQVYGPNLIQVDLESIATLLFRECLTPFYLFQFFSVTLWMSDDYIPYSLIILSLTTVSLSMEVFQLRKQQRKMREMVQKTEPVTVVRNYGQIFQIESDQLVPGDVLLLQEPCILQCDVMLISGSVTVSEAMLTGESIPLHKSALPTDELVGKTQERHMLYDGTQLLQVRPEMGNIVYSIVLRTGFSTTKGQLIRSIMFPKPIDVAFTRDLLKFVGVLACLASIGFIYTLVLKLYRGFPVWRVIIRAFDIVTAAVPPALPVILTIGIMTAELRLKLKQIFCTSPSSINTCGAIDTVCFDKTGTLTEDGLSFECAHCVIPPSEKFEELQMSEAISNVDQLFSNNYITKELRNACAACQSLTNINNEINGDPLDLVLFNWSQCLFSGSGDDGSNNAIIKAHDETFELEILKTYAFSSELQRMSVIVRECNLIEQTPNFHTLYAKGSPEAIASLCRPHTIPNNYRDLVDRYSRSGRRVLALAMRQLQDDSTHITIKKLRRDEVEKELQMVGIVVLENRLKSATCEVISQLNEANIRVLMITGDNLLTAVNVAKECKILQPSKSIYILDIQFSAEYGEQILLTQFVDSIGVKAQEIELMNFDFPPNSQLAISGPALQSILNGKHRKTLGDLIKYGSVFARISPDFKKFLVIELKRSGRTVAMCGDGSNDCSALKAAHVGVSLSEAEASIAAPFTAKRDQDQQTGAEDIRCIPTLISEGRAALVTSFCLFKYMGTYALTQFITTCLLYWFDIGLAPYQSLYVDLFLITMVAIFFAQTKASRKLSKSKPPLCLLNSSSIISISGQLLISTVFQFVALFYTMAQSWYVPFVQSDKEKEISRSMEGSAFFYVSNFQFLAFAIVYSKGQPHRQQFWTNRPMCTMLAICTVVSVLLVLFTPQIAVYWMDLVKFEWMKDRIAYMAIGFTSVVCSIVFEYVIVAVVLERMLH